MSSRVFNTWRDPYDRGFSTCRRRKIEINSGINILVGCNGAGKSTLLRNLKEELIKNKVPVYSYDNISDSPVNNKDKFMFTSEKDLAVVATVLESSEGENITIGLNVEAPKIFNFIKTGKIERNNPFAKIFDEDFEEEEITSKERWILFDTIGSGYSIDNIVIIKEFFRNLVFQTRDKYDLYIVISTNEYEFTYQEECFDVITGQYINFSSYEDYKKFILKSRERKDNRELAAEKALEKRKAKKEGEPESRSKWDIIRGD